MIQRIQSVYLLINIILGVMILFLPIWHISIPMPVGGCQEVVKITVMSVQETMSPSRFTIWNGLMLFLTLLLIGGSAFTTLKYHNRPLQIRMAKLMQIFSLLLLASLFLIPEMIKSDLNPLYKSINPSYGLSPFLCIPMVLFFVLAERAIKKDERLVRDSDRLR